MNGQDILEIQPHGVPAMLRIILFALRIGRSPVYALFIDGRRGTCRIQAIRRYLGRAKFYLTILKFHYGYKCIDHLVKG